MGTRITKKAARTAGDILDKAADLITSNAEDFGISQDISRKYALQCDLLSDFIAKRAGVNIAELANQRKGGAAGFDPDEIGEEVSGPLEEDAEEASYMGDQFTQQENRELREKQEAGELPAGSPEEQKPRPGVQASLETGKRLASLFMDINTAATRFADSDHAAVRTLSTKLASAGMDVLQFQTRVLEGSESGNRVAALAKAADHLLPHLAADVSPQAAEGLGRMADVLSRFAKAV